MTISLSSTGRSLPSGQRESRLELARLLFADYDRTMCQVIAQPFSLRTRVKQIMRQHIPDCMLVTDGIPTVVGRQACRRAQREKVRFTLDWTRELVEQARLALRGVD